MKNIHIKEQKGIESILNVESTAEPEFVKLYLKDIGRLWELDNSAQIVFGEMLKLVSYNPSDSIHNLVIINGSRRKQICEKLSNIQATAYVYYNRGVKNLVNKEVLKYLAKDTYLINPEICTKTNWSNVEMLRSIKMEITYEESSRTLITIVESNPELYKQKLNDFRGEESINNMA
jgi:hypothetical protein